jgi:two-component system, LytTR family, sensor histidine kinase AgrC
MIQDGDCAELNATCNVSATDEINEIKEQLALYIKENERLVNELKSLRHNTLNIIHGINAYIEFEDWDGLKKHFCSILEIGKNISDTSVSSIEKVLNASLKELLYSKFKNAISIGIDIKIMVESNIMIKNNLINENDLCNVIGEFCDNAIEIASSAFNKKVSIFILNSEQSISIIIENTFKEKPNISHIKSGDAATVKEGELGLQSARTIISKYPNILNNTFIQHQVLVQELQIIK